MSRTVIEIVKIFLEVNAYDGLFYDGVCACKVDDLAPCGNISGACQAGYLQKEQDDEFDFIISPEKELNYE